MTDGGAAAAQRKRPRPDDDNDEKRSAASTTTTTITTTIFDTDTAGGAEKPVQAKCTLVTGGGEARRRRLIEEVLPVYTNDELLLVRRRHNFDLMPAERLPDERVLHAVLANCGDLDQCAEPHGTCCPWTGASSGPNKAAAVRRRRRSPTSSVYGTANVASSRTPRLRTPAAVRADDPSAPGYVNVRRVMYECFGLDAPSHLNSLATGLPSAQWTLNYRLVTTCADTLCVNPQHMRAVLSGAGVGRLGRGAGETSAAARTRKRQRTRHKQHALEGDKLTRAKRLTGDAVLEILRGVIKHNGIPEYVRACDGRYSYDVVLDLVTGRTYEKHREQHPRETMRAQLISGMAHVTTVQEYIDALQCL